MKYISNFWRWLVEWFERGDLVPLLVLVSAYHYAAVLAGKDALLVAIAIGLLVDLGHYRTIRAAVRYNGDWKQAATRWVIAIGMTILSLNYHQRYYSDWWLSAPLPLLIAALAWLQHVDRRPAKETHHAEPAKVDAPIMRALPTHVCLVCGTACESQQSLAAHMRWKHAKEHMNGKTKIE